MHDNELLAPPAFTYEVAISFLAQDEPVAVDLRDRLVERMPVFVYPKNQEQLAGTDGTESFYRVFAEQARLVVVLYRPKWGQTNWTRVEEQAIHERRFFKSSHFILLVNMEDSKPKKPEWYSDMHIRLAFDPGKMAALADIVAYRVRVLGGDVRMETIEDLVARQKREIERLATFQKVYHSATGYSRLIEEFNRLSSLFNEASAKAATDLGLERGSILDHHKALYRMHGVALLLNMPKVYANTLHGVELVAELSNGRAYEHMGRMQEHERFDMENYVYAESGLGFSGWAERDARGTFYTSEALLDKWFRKMLALIHDSRLDAHYEKLN